MPKRILIHICCAPCAIYPFEVMKKEGFQVEGFFYNPNIGPQEEYLKRKEAVENFKDLFAIDIHFGDYQETEYALSAEGIEKKEERCKRCFQLRLQKTYNFALRNNFDYFTTTLLSSPYQNQETIKEAGINLVNKESKTQFLFYDFRQGFRQAQMKAKELGFYRQKYCGCLKSKLL